MNSYNSILNSDSNDLSSLSIEASTIIENYNVDLTNVMKTYTVDEKKEGYVNIHLKKGYVLQGLIVVSGGSGNDVDFALQDSSGTSYISKTRISNSYPLSFTAPKDDNYNFYLGNMFSTFSSKTVTFNMLNSKYYYFQLYVSWSKNYVNKVELMTQHLTDYENFVKVNENDLKDAGADTVKLETSISDTKIKLKQSVSGANDNIQSMSNYFESIAALQQQERQQTADIISALTQLLPLLG